MTHLKRSIEVPGLGHNAPIPVAARVGKLVCSSAIAGKNPETGQLPADATQQVANAFANLRLVLQAAGATPAAIAKLTVTVSDDSVREAVNAHWLDCFPDPADRPARHITVVALQRGMALQLEFIALIQKED